MNNDVPLLIGYFATGLFASQCVTAIGWTLTRDYLLGLVPLALIAIIICISLQLLPAGISDKLTPPVLTILIVGGLLAL